MYVHCIYIAIHFRLFSMKSNSLCAHNNSVHNAFVITVLVNKGVCRNCIVVMNFKIALSVVPMNSYISRCDKFLAL